MLKRKKHNIFYILSDVNSQSGKDEGTRLSRCPLFASFSVKNGLSRQAAASPASEACKARLTLPAPSRGRNSEPLGERLQFEAFFPIRKSERALCPDGKGGIVIPPFCLMGKTIW